MTGYDIERIAELLRLLPPPPEGWVRAAQELPQARAEFAGIVARAEEDAAFRAHGFTAQAEGLRVRTLPLAQLDGDVYAAALGVRARTVDLKPEQRDWEIGRAFSDSAAAPLEIARAGADVAELAAQLAASGDPR